MARLNDMQEYVVGEYVEHYQAGDMSRRELLRRVVLITGSVAGAAAVLSAAGCTPAATPAAATTAPQAAATTVATVAPTAAPTTAPTAAPVARAAPAGVPDASNPSGITVPINTAGIETLRYSFPNRGFTQFSYVARPAGAGPFPGIIIIHENRGLVGEHYNDLARRYATNGYAAMALDLLSPRGGTTAFTDPAAGTAALTQITTDDHIANIIGAADYWQNNNSYVKKGSIGAVGYCFGGGIVWRLATAYPALKAAAPYYGPNPALDAVKDIKAQVVGQYGGTDTRINAGIPELETALKAAGIAHEIKIYEGAGHAFNNDTGASFNVAAARAAWSSTMALFDKTLKS